MNLTKVNNDEQIPNSDALSQKLKQNEDNNTAISKPQKGDNNNKKKTLVKDPEQSKKAKKKNVKRNVKDPVRNNKTVNKDINKSRKKLGNMADKKDGEKIKLKSPETINTDRKLKKKKIVTQKLERNKLKKDI